MSFPWNLQFFTGRCCAAEGNAVDGKRLSIHEDLDARLSGPVDPDAFDLQSRDLESSNGSETKLDDVLLCQKSSPSRSKSSSSRASKGAALYCSEKYSEQVIPLERETKRLLEEEAKRIEQEDRMSIYNAGAHGDGRDGSYGARREGQHSEGRDQHRNRGPLSRVYSRGAYSRNSSRANSKAESDMSSHCSRGETNYSRGESNSLDTPRKRSPRMGLRDSCSPLCQKNVLSTTPAHSTKPSKMTSSTTQLQHTSHVINLAMRSTAGLGITHHPCFGVLSDRLTKDPDAKLVQCEDIEGKARICSNLGHRDGGREATRGSRKGIRGGSSSSSCTDASGIEEVVQRAKEEHLPRRENDSRVEEGKWNYSSHSGMYFGQVIASQKHNGKILRHGYGRFVEQNGAYEYEGSWKHDRISGHGYLKTSTSMYTGELKRGKKEGPSSYELYFADGSTYCGAYKNGFRHGYGELFTPSQRYRGDFRDGRKNGEGILVWDGGKYSGQFLNDEMDGFGVLETSKWTFSGNFERGLQHGEGDLTRNGKTYHGFWVRGNEGCLHYNSVDSASNL